MHLFIGVLFFVLLTSAQGNNYPPVITFLSEKSVSEKGINKQEIKEQSLKNETVIPKVKRETTNMFIISLTYKVSLERVEQYIPEHIVFLDEQYTQGNFLLSGRKEPRTGGVILADVASKNELIEILKQDPFQREGLADYDITQMVPTKAAKQLQFLLK